MTFDLNFYSTPLLFGFLQGWIYAVLFWVRGWRQLRLSDYLLGFLLATMTFEVWEYMLGFAGIEILWRELEFFPRTFGLLVMPLAYLYLKSQFNSEFRLQKSDLKHAIPYGIYVLYHLIVFAQGPAFVQQWLTHVHYPFQIENIEWLSTAILRVFYFYWSFQLFNTYRKWTYSQYSDPDAVSFKWFRNFLWAFLFAYALSFSITVLDTWLKLDFWHDWWDELFYAGLIYYTAITGYAQTQPRKMHFVAQPVPVAVTENKTDKLTNDELVAWKSKIETLMTNEKLYLEPELTLSDVAQRLKTNVSVLSSVINGAFEKNFNDYVNEYRVAEVKRLLKDPSTKHLSLLGIGMECGFNSKSTFNRAFKKATGQSPREFVE